MISKFRKFQIQPHNLISKIFQISNIGFDSIQYENLFFNLLAAGVIDTSTTQEAMLNVFRQNLLFWIRKK